MEGVIDNSFLESHAEEEFSNAIDVSSVVGVLNNRFSRIQAVMKLVSKLVSHKYVLNACASLLLLNLSSVSLVVFDGFFKDKLEVIRMRLLLLAVFQLVSSLNAFHSPELLFKLPNTIEYQKGLL